MTSINELRAKRFKIVQEAQRIAGNDMDAGTARRFDAMMKEADDLKFQIDRLERSKGAEARELERMRARAMGENVSIEYAAEEIATEEEAFTVWARHGENALSPEQRIIFAKSFQAAQSTGTDSAGGYTVPQGFYDRLIDAEKAYGGMVDASFVFDTATGNALPIPTDNDTTNAGAILGENTQVSTQDVTFGAVTFGAFTYTSNLVKVSNELMQDSAFDFGAWLSDKFGGRIGRATNAHFTGGDGASKPTGMITVAPVGATAASETELSFDDVLEILHSVDPAYRNGAKFMFSDATLGKMKKIKDLAGRPLWLPGLAEMEPDTLCGYSYVINQDMDAPAAGAKTIAFGDLSKYFIRRVAGARVLRLAELFADSNQTGFLAFQRWDGNLVDAGTNPIKLLQMAAK